MAAPDLSRRALLRGHHGSVVPPGRPPWALAEAGFSEACTRCGDCLAACPEGILVAGDGGFPEVDFRRGACTFCGDCVKACASGALSAAISPAWALRARVDHTCLARRGVHCQSCRDACEPEAIRFAYLGSVPVPEVDLDACSGCGACVAACPADAIAVLHAETA
ncbi:MAG TPA: ferredoxin-type protein NapF [Xanthomonadaceae bacterium]|nr:ferredoxin-type protein NapF [Xanthomonadaceae bacterium]